jgi:hAT family C-terminal dimerisation region
VKANPRVFWKKHEDEFPILARIARDILSIPASGAGVERLFNCARDICHYRRGQLKAETIKDLMLHLCSSKFELEQSELDMVKEYLSDGEAAMIDQARKPTPPLTDLEPISDDEEDGSREDKSDDSDSQYDSEEDEQEDMQSPTQPTTQSRQAQQKRRRSKTTEAIDDEDSGLPLPEMPTEESATQARPGRIRKKPKMPDGFEIHTL